MRLDRPLSLHQLTALDAGPLDLIAIAGALGCEHVCLFTHVPEQARHVYPMVTPAMRAQVADALGEAKVSLYNLEVFPLTVDANLDDFRPGLEIGTTLGAHRATAHIHIADEAEAADSFGQFCDVAMEHDLSVGLEFNAFSKVRSPVAAAAIVQAAARANGDIALDFLHAVRGGATPDALAPLAPLVGYAQICDGPAEIAREERWREAIENRALPGKGAFPIAEMLAPLRADIVIEVEVPQHALRDAGVPALDRARRAVAAARRFTGGSAHEPA